MSHYFSHNHRSQPQVKAGMWDALSKPQTRTNPALLPAVAMAAWMSDAGISMTPFRPGKWMKPVCVGLGNRGLR